MKKNIAVLCGDGIGPEVTHQSIKVLDSIAQHFGHVFTYTYSLMGARAIDKTGSPLPEETIKACMNSDAVLLGAVGHPKYDNDPTRAVRPEQGLLQLRKILQLYANIRPVSTHPSLHSLSPLKSKHLESVDFVIFRELTGGIYFGKKYTNPERTEAFDECTYSSTEIERVARLAFQHARGRKKHLTLVDKANVLETSRLWRHVVQTLATEYSDVRVDYMFIDNAAMQLMIHPAQFDVILTDNMFGDILSDEASVISGSLGLLPSASVGDHSALFEPIHGSYPQATDKNIANPIGSILSSAMMLEYFELHEEATLIREAVEWTLTSGFVTKDIKAVNYCSTSAIGNFICAHSKQRVTQGKSNKRNVKLERLEVFY